MKKCFKYFLLIIAALPIVLAGANAGDLKIRKQIVGTGAGFVAAKAADGSSISGLVGQVAIESRISNDRQWVLHQGFWSWDGDTASTGKHWDEETASNLYNFPNPFSTSTTIKYELPGAANITIKIYDLLGNEIATLYDGFQNSGEKSLTWNATDSRGSNLSSGSYLCELVARPAQLAGNSSFSAFTLRNVMVIVK